MAAKVAAIDRRGDQYQVIVQISPKYRGSFNTLAFGAIKPHSGSLRNGRLDLVYHQNPPLASEIRFRFGRFIDGRQRGGGDVWLFVGLPVGSNRSMTERAVARDLVRMIRTPDKAS